MHLVLKDGHLVDVVGPDGESVANIIHQTPQKSGLLPVRDRGGNEISAPTSHLGEPMEPQPHIAADLGLRWIEALVATAVAMSKT